jgi:signal transduction histidine kinase
MRAVIDSMDPLVDDLSKLFGSLRSRFEALLRRNDLRFVWNVGELPTTPWLGPEHYLHILRILQEAVANAIKHAAPTELEVSVVCVDGAEPGLRIAVRDDGRESAASDSSGRGIGHMRTRARALGGELRIVELDPGTCVELWLPEPRSGTSASVGD